MKSKNAVAVLIVAAVAACLAAIYVAGERLGAGAQGPSKIARAPDGTVWVVSDGALHQFSAQGEPRREIPLGALGRGPLPSDLVPLADGSMVIAEADPSAAYRCDLAAMRCALLTGAIAQAIGPTRHALMIAADETARRYYISDNANHRLILLDFDGRVLDATQPRRLIYPNEIEVAKPGEIVVADTNHHRLVRIGVAGDRFGADLWQMRTDRNNLHRVGRVWPMDFTPAAQGGWWVLDARDGMRDADLLRFDPGGQARERVDLGPDADPTQIMALEDGLLVADPKRASLVRVGADGSAAWGGAVFGAELAKLKATRSFWARVRLAAQVLVVVAPLLGIALLWRMGERLPQRAIRFEEATTATPVEDGVHWIGVRPEFLRRVKRLQLGSLGLVVLVFAAFAWLTDVSALLRSSPMLRIEVVAIAVILALQALFLVRRPPGWRKRIGTDGSQFYFDPGNGGVEAYSFDALATVNGQQLLAGKRLIALATRTVPIFDPDEVRGYILARIPASGRMSAAQLSRRALRQGSGQMWAAAVIIVIGLAVWVLPFFFPKLVLQLKTLLGNAVLKATSAR